MIGDEELAEFREGYYRVLASLFAREPAADFLRSLSEGLARRIEASINLNPTLGEGWTEVASFLSAGADVAERVADEFTVLFVGPRPALNPYESYYLAGKMYAEPLSVVRSFLRRAGLTKNPEAPDPEDSVASEFEVMGRLVERQRQARDPDGEATGLHVQAEFLKHHILVWIPRFASDLLQEKHAVFYRGAAKLCLGFLEIEREVIAPWGPEGVKTYEEARQAMVRRGEWQGPLFEPPGPPEEGAGSSG
ncbi:MAG: molecular chaperone [Candidatus Methylomirabilia bacterium]